MGKGLCCEQVTPVTGRQAGGGPGQWDLGGGSCIAQGGVALGTHSLGTSVAVASEGQQTGPLVQPTSMAECLSLCFQSVATS